MSQEPSAETSAQLLQRQAQAVLNLPHEEPGMAEAARRSTPAIWPEMEREALDSLVESVLESDHAVHGLSNIRRGWHNNRAQERVSVDPTEAWPRLLPTYTESQRRQP